MVRFLFFSLLIALSSILSGCDLDIFNLGCKPVTANYCLHRWEDGKTYYLEDKDHESKNGGGVLDGVVEQIGWNDNYIIAKRHSTFGGDPNGWMVVDVKLKTVKGPYDDHAIQSMSESKGIMYFDSAKAWSDLR